MSVSSRAFLWGVAGLPVSQRRGCDNWLDSDGSRAPHSTLHGVVFAILVRADCGGPHWTWRAPPSLRLRMSLFAKLSTYDERSARLAGIGLMLLSIFMFSFGDALGKFHGRDLFGRPVAVAARLRRAAGAAADDVEAARRIHPPRAAVAATAARHVVHARGRGVLSRHRLFAARRRHHLLPGVADLRHRAVGDRARRARRLAALDRDPGRVLRRADCDAPFHADGELAGDDRARWQSVVCLPDADHALAARDAGYRAGIVAIRRYVPARRPAVADRLGDTVTRQSRDVLYAPGSFRWARCSASTAR